MNKLVIVESPAKAKTIEKYLGEGYQVLPTIGHIRELPKKDAIDPLNDYAMNYIISPGKEAAVKKIKSCAKSCEEIIFTSGTTESINLVAASLGKSRLTDSDEVVVTWMEHHSNIVPWQLICEQTGAQLLAVPMTPDGELDLDEYEQLLSDRTKIVAVGHVSNALGTINPLEQIIAKARDADALVIIDGAQATPHFRIDVQALDCDFYAFSGHKMFGPTGIGVLYGKSSLLDAMPPYQGGGEMILTVSFKETLYNTLPYKFEAGTPNIL